MNIARRGKSSARKVKRSLILCKADEGLNDQEIADALLVGASTVSRVRQRFVEEGLESALNERPRPGQRRKLDSREEPYDPQRPKVCFGETSQQLVAETRVGVSARPGQVARYDYEYQRNGTRNLFLFVEPQGGWRHVAVSERRTMRDFAHQMP